MTHTTDVTSAMANDMTAEQCRSACRTLRCALLFPADVPNLQSALKAALAWCEDIFVVDDGASGNLAELLRGCDEQVTVIAPPKENADSNALAVRHIASLGFDYLITMDAEDVVCPSAVSKLVAEELRNEGSLVIGSRLPVAGADKAKVSFADRLSNLLFKVETLISLRDSRSALRVYPLRHLREMRFLSGSNLFGHEALVRLAWAGARVTNVIVPTIGTEEGGAPHSHKWGDALKLGALHLIFCLIAFLWFYPVAVFRWLKRNLFHTGETPAQRASAVALGLTMSVMPIWGFQTVAAVGLAHLLKVNKVLVGAFANVSLPPVIPFIIYGGLFLGSKICGVYVPLDFESIAATKVESIADLGDSALAFVVGSVALGLIIGALAWPLAWLFIRLLDRQTPSQSK